MKHVVIDARLIETSTGRYMQRLVEGVNDQFATSEQRRYTVLVPSQYVSKWQKRLNSMRVVAADQKWYTLSEQWSLYWQLRQLKPDLVHFTMPQQPLLWSGPAITTIHDVTLIRFNNLRPGDSKLIYWVRKKIFLGLLHVVIRRSKAILTPTEFVRQDLGRYFGERFLRKIRTTLLAGEIPDAEPEPIDSLAGKKYLFFVGNAFPYKNIWRIIEAFKKLQPDYPELHLALAGKKEAFYEGLEQRAKSEGIEQVHFLGFISDGEKRWALQNSQAFVTASYSEGFCMPVLEAMIEGAPVISSDASCLPEVVGPAGTLFNPDSSDELAAAIRQVLGSRSKRQAMSKAGKQHASSFSWERMVNQAHRVYVDVLSK